MDHYYWKVWDYITSGTFYHSHRTSNTRGNDIRIPISSHSRARKKQAILKKQMKSYSKNSRWSFLTRLIMCLLKVRCNFENYAKRASVVKVCQCFEIIIIIIIVFQYFGKTCRSECSNNRLRSTLFAVVIYTVYKIKHILKNDVILKSQDMGPNKTKL